MIASDCCWFQKIASRVSVSLATECGFAALANALTGGYQLAFMIAAGCVLVGTLVAILVLRSPDPIAAQAPERVPAIDDARLEVEAA